MQFSSDVGSMLHSSHRTLQTRKDGNKGEGREETKSFVLAATTRTPPFFAT